MAKAPVRITRDLSHPETAGVHHRIICMTGKNRGLCYYLRDSRVVMGRSNKADIQIMDTQASREHLEIVKVGNNFVLTDLGSQNGVMVNDLKVKQHKLKNGDKIIIGTTVYKFGILDILPAVVEEEDEDDDEYEEEEEEVKKPKKKKKAPASPQDKRKKLIYLVVAIGVGMMMMETPEEKPKAKKKEDKKNTTAFVDTKPRRKRTGDVEEEIRKKVEAYIHRGRREAREGNHFRAMEEFSLALMLDPQNGDAAFHMNRSKQRLDEKVEAMRQQATKAKDSLKFQQALGTYCSIYKLLKDYPDDERFKEAKKNAEDMALNKLGMEESENYCY